MLAGSQPLAAFLVRFYAFIVIGIVYGWTLTIL